MEDWYEKEQLHFAAADDDLEKVKKLIEDGYEINAFDEALSFTPLHHAAKNGHFKIVEYLLSIGANVDAHDQERAGDTPLGEIAENCSYEMANLLIKAGANPTTPGWMQISALDRANKRKNEEGKKVYELLLKTAKNKFNTQK